MKKIIVAFSVVLMATGIVACRHTTDFSAYPTISFNSEVYPVLISNCTQAKCHGDVDPSSFELLTYDEIIHNCKVEAGKPENSKLYEVIRALSGENQMPQKPYEMLTDEQIQKIYLWIGQGAANN